MKKLAAWSSVHCCWVLSTIMCVTPLNLTVNLWAELILHHHWMSKTPRKQRWWMEHPGSKSVSDQQYYMAVLHWSSVHSFKPLPFHCIAGRLAGEMHKAHWPWEAHTLRYTDTDKVNLLCKTVKNRAWGGAVQPSESSKGEWWCQVWEAKQGLPLQVHTTTQESVSR